MSAEYNGLNELYKIIICVIGFGYVLYFFRDLMIPYVIALFLLYLLRPLARIMKGSFEKCFRSPCAFPFVVYVFPFVVYN